MQIGRIANRLGIQPDPVKARRILKERFGEEGRVLVEIESRPNREGFHEWEADGYENILEACNLIDEKAIERGEYPKEDEEGVIVEFDTQEGVLIARNTEKGRGDPGDRIWLLDEIYRDMEEEGESPRYLCYDRKTWTKDPDEAVIWCRMREDAAPFVVSAETIRAEQDNPNLPDFTHGTEAAIVWLCSLEENGGRS